RDCWWNTEKMIRQICTQAVPIFNLSYSQCQVLFLFDNSKIHNSLSANALHAYNMNLNTGSEVPIMQDIWFRDQTGNQVSQPINFPNLAHIPCTYRGKQKGLRVILQEWGLWHDGLPLECGSSQRNCVLGLLG
ncbi:hypothetical protein C7212DRAFT_193287, partial [Tuber magnatum]